MSRDRTASGVAKDVAAEVTATVVEHAATALGAHDVVASAAGAATSYAVREILDDPAGVARALNEQAERAAPAAWEIVDVIR